jgi:hypothetical protein
MDMNNTPCDMCKGCFVPETMEKLDAYNSEDYFSCYDCACYGCADLHSCTGQCATQSQEVE